MNLTDWGLTYKILFLGDPAVGKRSIRDRIVTGEFQHEVKATIGVPMNSIRLRVDGQEQPVKLLLWTPPGMFAGPRQYESMLRGQLGLIVIYDITRESTFDNLSLWLIDALKHSSRILSVAIVGNKTDLREVRIETIDTERGKEFAERISNEIDIPTIFLETSAKTGENIPELLPQLVGMMISNFPDDPSSFF
ncbi:MAG: GTP-binding protein [Candidatus Thorarchaeota archaeon]|nr:MAG: GTP-binding protein [Candidatus Thorarchaeota archaeon]